jgi:hypothetical protein
VLEVCDVHVIPSGEVIITLFDDKFHPMATNSVPAQITSFSDVQYIAVPCVHVTPLGEVRMGLLVVEPEGIPTVTNFVPDQATPYIGSVVFEVCNVHTTPSGDVRIVPRSPTVTNCVPDQTT